jgi:hypothetical protein
MALTVTRPRQSRVRLPLALLILFMSSSIFQQFTRTRPALIRVGLAASNASANCSTRSFGSRSAVVRLTSFVSDEKHVVISRAGKSRAIAPPERWPLDPAYSPTFGLSASVDVSIPRTLPRSHSARALLCGGCAWCRP